MYGRGSAERPPGREADQRETVYLILQNEMDLLSLWTEDVLVSLDIKKGQNILIGVPHNKVILKQSVIAVV